MRFRFRAAPLLALRERQLEAARARLARANEEATAADALFAEGRQAEDEAAASYCDALDRGTDHASLERHRTWIGHQRTHVEVRRHTQAACHGVVAARSGDVTAAHRRLRMLERLGERLRLRHETAVRRREMREIDQLATLQHARRIAEGGQT